MEVDGKREEKKIVDQTLETSLDFKNGNTTRNSFS
jgi:hypothetical protein